MAATVVVMPWIVKGLLVLAKTRRGRELLFATTLGVMEIARSEPARKLYAKAGKSVNETARKAARATRRRPSS